MTTSSPSGKRLVVQIPCYNEEATLAETVRAIPRSLPGIREVLVLVIDDGSRDRTYEVCQSCGADYVVRHPHNKGLAAAFRSGLSASLRLGADVIVNTDADHQYDGASIPDLVAPIVAGEADMVVGNRRVAENREFSWIKRWLQRIGSRVVNHLSGVPVPDAVSGFRALSRSYARQVIVHSTFSYTTETLIQAGRLQARVVSVPVKTNPVQRESRLFRSIPEFLLRSGVATLRSYAMYHPFRVFATAGLLLMGIGSIAFARFLYLYFWLQTATGHVQSLVIGGALIAVGCGLLVLSVLADLVGTNRRLLEELLHHQRLLEGRLSPDDLELARCAASHHPEAEAPRLDARPAWRAADVGPPKPHPSES